MTTVEKILSAVARMVSRGDQPQFATLANPEGLLLGAAPALVEP